MKKRAEYEMHPTKRCETCIYWMRSTVDVLSHEGECRVRPPLTPRQRFPLVYNVDWCSEWTERDEAPCLATQD